jgi:integrase
MSRKNSPQRQLHLVFTESAGFQFYYTLPSHFSRHPSLPRQLRWSLGRDEPLARQLCSYLDNALKSLAKVPVRQAVQEIEETSKLLELLHRTIRIQLDHAQQIWRRLPHPSALAKSDMSEGRRRFDLLQSQGVVLYRNGTNGEMVFTLQPSPKLCALTRFDWHRLDWPLGTNDESAAVDAAVYILTAISELEKLSPEQAASMRWEGAFSVMALYEYLSYARPDQGAALEYLPSWLPQSLTALNMHIGMYTVRTPMRLLTGLNLRQRPDGMLSLTQDLVWSGSSKKVTLDVCLETTSPIIGYLLYMRLAQRLDSALVRHCAAGLDDDTFARGLKEISEIVKEATSYFPRPEPMPVIPSASPITESKQSPSDPAAFALMTALGSLLSAEKRQQMEAIFSEATDKLIVVGAKAPDVDTMTVAQLVEHYESTQLRHGCWRNPRTRISVRARLEGMCELLGGHRSIGSLTRADMIALREKIRRYPKNRNKLAAIRHVPLSQLLEDPNVEPLNPRTAKKFFELIRAVMRHAYDHGLLQSDIASNLVFTIKGAESPRKRTYTPGQIEKLLKGPALTLETPPKWRLDDYKFWLPLLGLYTGCRLSELCQLQIKDVVQEDGVWVISINRDDGKELKTEESERSVPLHHALLKAGFLDFVQRRKTATNDARAALFDKLKTHPTLASSHHATKWFLGHSKPDAGYLGLCELAADRLTFHGLRHTFIQQFRRQKLDMLILKALVGHADKTTTGGYGDVYPAKVLREELDKIDYGISLSHVSYKNYVSLQELQGVFRIGRPARPSNQ